MKTSYFKLYFRKNSDASFTSLISLYILHLKKQVNKNYILDLPCQRFLSVFLDLLA